VTDIDEYVDRMPLGAVSRSMTRFIFKHMLIKRAYAPSDFERMAAASRFEDCEIRPAGIGIDIWLRKPGRSRATQATTSASDFSPLLFV